MRAPSGETRFAAVIGSPVEHSLSPLLFNTAFEAADIDWVYVALEVELLGVPDAFAGIRALGLGGVSVTMPDKEAAAACADSLTPDAELLGAVNCIVNIDGHLVGHNTDGAGFVAALDAELQFDPSGLRCVVLGAGGSARSIALALVRASADEVVIVNRTSERADKAVALLGAVGRAVAPADAHDVLRSADLIVNATSVGMGDPSDDDVPFDISLIHSGQVVVDIVYRPLRTPLLIAAAAQGASTANGVSMLIHQAAIQFELWTGRAAPVEAMTAAVADKLA
jgi:shikimate dehydrogenase